MSTVVLARDQLAVRRGVEITQLADGGVELSIANHKLTLNPVGSRIWAFLAKGHSEAETVDGLASLYAVDRDRIGADVLQFVKLLKDNLIITSCEFATPELSSGVYAQELLDADGPNTADALRDALGDSYLCSQNRVYGLIRRQALSHGYRYVSGSMDSLSVAYGVFALSCLGRILSDRAVPYFQTRTVLERVENDHPRRRVPLRFLSSNLKSNYTLHESSHGVAHETMAPNPFRVANSPDSEELSTIINALVEEAFANTAERLASMEAKSLLHQTFFAWNSYLSADAADQSVLEKAHYRFGDEATFYLLLFGHVIANLYSREPPTELTAGLFDCLGVESSPTSRNLARMALNLNVAFRAETNPSYFQLLDLREPYEKLCQLPMEAHLDLVDSLKPWAVQLCSVLYPDSASQTALKSKD